jgi:nitrogen regulatory protein PII
MKKLEIVTNKSSIERIIEILNKTQISGYSLFEHVKGMGERGLMMDDELTGAFENVYLFTLCDEQKAMEIAEKIMPVIEKYGGLCILSDVSVIKKAEKKSPETLK